MGEEDGYAFFVFLRKSNAMDTSELKLRILKEIDSLEQGKLQEVYGYLQNFLRSDKDLNDWDILSAAQKDGIQNAIDDLDAGKGIVHEDVISKYRKKYPNA
jgi:hypothetical protein